jgi:hypothetical protein
MSRVYKLTDPSHISRFAGVTGLYSFWEFDECIYVGKADCLMSRVCTQMKRFILATGIMLEPFDDLDGLSYLEVKEYLRIREAMLIELEKPRENIIRPKWNNLTKLKPAVLKKLNPILELVTIEEISKNHELSTNYNAKI